MKKFTLMAALAMTAMPMMAEEATVELVENPTIDKTFANWEGKKAIYDVAIISDDAKAALEAREDVKVNTVERWFETWGDMGRYAWQGGDNEEFLNTVGPDGGVVKGNGGQALLSMYEWWSQWWSMAVCQQKTAIDLSHVNANTRLHMAFKMLTDVVTSPLNISLFTTEDNADNNHIYACPKFTLTSETFNPEGAYKAEYPIIATLKQGVWQGVDITLGELDAINKANNGDEIDYDRLNNEWTGRLWTIAVPSKPDQKLIDGSVFALDAVYLYTPVDELDGIETVDAESVEADVLVSANTVSVAGAESIEVYDMAGRLVSAAAGSVAGIEGLKGVYVVKAANTVKKVVL